MAFLIDELSDKDREKAKKTSMPLWTGPMLATLTHDYFSGEDWLFERKFDGERVMAYVSDDGSVRLLSRNKKHLNDNYPEIEKALSKQARTGCILDGEVVAFDQNRVSDFQRLQPRMQASSREDAEKSGVKVHYYIFDCLYVDGHDITKLPLESRKKLLKKAVDWEDPVHSTAYRRDDGLDFYKDACEKGWEGLIAKKADSAYAHSRSSNWLKFKCVMQQEFVIGGYTEPEGERIGFGALLLGFYRQGKLVYAGEVGTGFDDQTLKKLHNRMNSIERKTSPFDQGNPQTKDVHFVTPDLVCEVAFTEWTGEDKLRHPRYKGLRRDKDAKDVQKEKESQAAELD